MRAQIRDLQETISAEIAKIVEAARNDASETRIREQSLQNSLDKAQNELNEQAQATSRLGELQHEVQVNRSLYEAFLTRLNETDAQSRVQQADARIVSLARPPLDPSFPPRKILFVLAAVGALAISGLVAIVVNKLDRRVMSAKQIETAVGSACIGMIPRIQRKYRNNPFLYLCHNPSSVYAEAVRSTFIMLNNTSQRGSKSLLVTSALPGEGKTTFSISLAYVAATSSARVVLVDCDIRRPRIGKVFRSGTESGSDLCDYLYGRAEVLDILHAPEGARFSVITGSPANSTDIETYPLHSHRFFELLQTLRSMFDIIIIDSPPVLAVSDAVFISNLVDATVLATRWGVTTRDSMSLAADLLAQAGTKIDGIILNDVSLRRHARFGYHDRGEYYARVRDYYLPRKA